MQMNRNQERCRCALAVAAMGATGFWAAQDASAQLYRVRDLGTLGGQTSVATAVNAAGVVVGYSDTGEFDGNQPVVRGFAWFNGRMIQIGTLGGLNSYANDINNTGQIAGTAYDAEGWPRAFRIEGGRMVDLGTLGGHSSFGMGINAAGEVVGYAETAAGEMHACVWSDEGVVDLGTLGGPTSFAQAINDLGWVVGVSELADGRVRGFVWNGETMSELATLGGDLSYAEDINNDGEIVGFAKLPSGLTHGAKWTVNGEVINVLDIEPDALAATYAYGLSEEGEIVGVQGEGTFVYHGLFMDNTQRLIPNYAATPKALLDINANGWAVGQASFANGLRACLLEKAPPLELQSSPLLLGQPMVMKVTNAIPGSTVLFYYTPQGLTDFPLWHISVVMGIDCPMRVGSAVADANGVASITGTIPPIMRPRPVWLQAAVVGNTSNIIETRIYSN